MASFGAKTKWPALYPAVFRKVESKHNSCCAYAMREPKRRALASPDVEAIYEIERSGMEYLY